MVELAEYNFGLSVKIAIADILLAAAEALEN